MNINEINEAFDREYEKYKNSPEYKEGFAKIKMPTYYIAKYSYEDLRAAVLAEREACAKLCDEKALYFQYDFIAPYDVADSCAEKIRARDMSTKPQNIDTSEERVHKSDKSVHDDDDIQEYKKPWVGLTDEECDEIWGECLGVFDCLKMTEAKLKEKNA